jgi:uroporphyrinogen III methyltransferase / synthase
MSASTDGIVYLIGAGPGDPDLITIKGNNLLFSADAVVFDNLVPLELVVRLGESVEKHYVGKKAGDHPVPQEEINHLLVKLAREGKRVARLKGGDPFVFGRGGEEVRFLKESGVPYVVVPGITAGIAGAAYAGIPVTDRSRASWVMFATGHKAKDKEVTSVPWDWVSQGKNGTLVIYMGVGEIKNIVEKLIADGMSADTPSCAIERATSQSQRITDARLADLPARVAEENIQPPALICVGEVCDLREAAAWFSNKPLLGKRIMVTRPADQATDLYRQLRSLGAEVLPYQTIATREYIDRSAWDQCRRMLSGRKWLVFTSENGVRYFMRQFAEEMGDMRGLGEYNIGAVGAGTARALESYSLSVDFVPTTATVAELAGQMAASVEVAGTLVIRVQGNLSDHTVADTLTKAGADVIGLTVYETFAPAWPGGFKEKLLAEPPDIIMFSSGSPVDYLSSHLSAEEIRRVTGHADIVSIGPSTSRHVEAQGLNVTIEAKVHSIPTMVEEMVAYYSSQPVGGRK